MTNRNVVIIALLLFAAGIFGGQWLSGFISETPPGDDRVPADPGSPGPAEEQQAEVSADWPRPAFAMADLDGRSRNIAEWDGKAVVLNFWATWCAPCRTEIPAFNRLQEKYADRGVQFIGVAIDEAEAVDAFMKIIPIDYPVLAGEADAIRVATDYGNDAGILPYTVFIDPRGMIDSIANGAVSEQDAEAAITALLRQAAHDRP